MMDLTKAFGTPAVTGTSPRAIDQFVPYDGAKRLADIVAATVALVLLAPLFALIAVAIKLDSRGPVFFVQRRVGRDRRRAQMALLPFDNVIHLDVRREDLTGKPFDMIKFRSMRLDAETVTGPVWASKDDPRVTRVGRFLRRSRLDELPQFINVLRGEMTLIGPRPERPEFVTELARQVDRYGDRHVVTPGITGLAQVRQGYDRCLDDVRHKVRYDLQYIEHRSLWLDLHICWSTVRIMCCGEGAR